MADVLGAIGQGFLGIAQINVFPLMILGVLVGTLFAAVPGIGGLTATILLLPLAMSLEPYQCIALLLGIGAISQTANTYPSVLMAVPGSVGSMATIVDGYPMAQKGEAARAFGAAYTASAIGGIFGAIVLAASIPVIRPMVLALGSPEFFVLIVWGLSMIAVLSGKAPLKGFLAASVGLLLATIGMDPKSGVPRFVFDIPYLWDGIPLILVALGAFAIPEVIAMAVRGTSIAQTKYGSGLTEGIKDAFRNWWLMLRCSAIGAWVGFIPGLGSSVADWFAYGHAVQTEKNKENFGKGDVRGVIAPESANNAKEGGGLIPTVAFGIPGSTSLAIVLIAFLAVGIQPGPQMLTSNLHLVFAMIWVLVLANLMATGLCLGMGKTVAKVSFLPYYTIVPMVLVMCVVAAVIANYNWLDLGTLLVLSVLGYFMKKYGWPRPPLLLGAVLGPKMEKFLWLSMARYYWTWLYRPGVIILFVLIIVTVWLLPSYMEKKGKVQPTTGV